MIIFQELNQLDVLLSLADVSKRLDKIGHDRNFTSHLTVFECLSKGNIRSLPGRIVDRFLEVLPSIHDQIKWLNLEATYMERILLATDYPSLYGLGLYGIDIKKAISFFTEDNVFARRVGNQISYLVIDMVPNNEMSSRYLHNIVFTDVFTMFINLQYLKFYPSSLAFHGLIFDKSLPTFVSSTLLELHVNVHSFTDCLYLLDGRFKQLRNCHVNIFHIKSTSLTIANEEKLPNLRCFSIRSIMRTHVYDELIVPLLQRMFNLEKLDLCLKVNRNEGFIDGNDLKKNIINHMSRLNQFTCNIRLYNHSSNQTNVPSNKDIQHSFKYFINKRIISCADHFQEKHYSYCHFYSHPYRLKHYDNVSNNFPGGLFKFVYEVSLHDERPFEHDFFLQIAHSFPCMKELTLINKKPQKNKSKNNNQDLLIIQYPHLTTLNLLEAHDDYVELFLLDTKLYLPNNVRLCARYESLRLLTDNFERDETRINSAKMHYACYDNVLPNHFKDYFLNIEMPLLCLLPTIV
ncbi:unnamed protein product [Rotaria magnacalcarata]|nr:unnamed protein product [Rotaria magnacalcarata]